MDGQPGSKSRISGLPFRARLAVCLLYMIAVGLVFAGATISYLRGYWLGILAGLLLELLLIIHLIRKA